MKSLISLIVNHPFIVALFSTTAFLFLVLNSSCNFLELNEKEIIKGSKAAFENQQFKKEPLQRAKFIEAFANFLLMHSDTLLMHNQHAGWKKIEFSKGNFMFFEKKTNQCFTFVDTNSNFMNFYVPAFLIDSINFYCESIGKHLIPTFTICPKTDYMTNNKTVANLKLNLSYGKDNPKEPHYYLQHFIYANRKEEVKTEIRTIDEVFLKDTTLIGNLKYAIQVIPYSGL